jgi:hypothetical protein
VVTAAVATTMLRMTLLPVSATKMTAPCGEAAMPAGWQKIAPVPVPSAAVPPQSAPPAPEPASVVVAPLAMTTARMRLLPVSATNSLPSAKRQSAAGALKALLVPAPSA